MSVYDQTIEKLRETPRAWVITGVAGFIGSNLLETLLELDQTVVGLDNFATGKPANLDEVRERVGEERWSRFRFLEGDICELETCRQACEGADCVLHQAALGSVPRSLANPIASHESNITGTLNMLLAARDGGAGRFVYASSSSVYGDHPELPKVEDRTGNCLSPYAATKKACEIYADVIARAYGLECVGLRYFNVFGPRQDPEGPYAAVIPKWVAAMLEGERVCINGDGETSRDFCYVANAVQANVLAAVTTNPEAVNTVYNVAVHARTTLNELFDMIRRRLAATHPSMAGCEADYQEFREGDVRHSEADIGKARRLLGYEPTHTVEEGLDEALAWYMASHDEPAPSRAG